MLMKKFRAAIEHFLLSPAHPFLLSAYFVLRVYAHNAHSIPAKDLIRPLFISLLVSAGFFLLFLRFVRNRHTAAFMTSILVLAFYLYMLGWALLPGKKYLPAGSFAPLWALAAVSLIALLGWKIRGLPKQDLISGINLMAVILLLFPIIDLAVVAISRSLFPPPLVRHTVEGTLPSSPPDIYYIILDSYPRADVLEETYGYDNSEFLQALRDLGFYVAECSQSNYTITGLTLTSSLNLDYLQNISDSFHAGTGEFLGLFKYLDNNSVQASLSGMGYKTMSFASGFPWAEWRDADDFIEPPDGPMTEFETLLLQSTFARILDITRIVDFDEKYANRFRTRTRLILGSFERLAGEPGPKFVFIHLIAPHPPFAFDENGNAVLPGSANSRDGFLNQVKFINKFILPGLKTLVEKSSTPPVIILQGDHGPIVGEDISAQLKILNAYYLPKGRELIYHMISPVNNFRIVFNSYFGTSFPLLEDVSYYSDRYKRYDFSVIPNSCPE